MAALTIDEVKNYLHVDFDADDNLIAVLMSAADLYLKGAISAAYPNDDERAKTLSLIIISDLYDNREMNDKVSRIGASDKVNGITRKLVDDFALQLRLELRA